MRGVREGQVDLWSARLPAGPTAPAGAGRGTTANGGADALASALSGVAHLPTTLAGVEQRLGRIEARLDELRRALPPILATLPEAARTLGVSYATIRRMKKTGRLPMVGTGRSARVDLSALHALSEDAFTRAAAQGHEAGAAAAREGQEDGDGAT